MNLRVVDNDKDEITVMNGGFELRGWSYANETERRVKMLGAREYVEGFGQATELLKGCIDTCLNNYLCEMKPDMDDSITGFNEAWDEVRKLFT